MKPVIKREIRVVDKSRNKIPLQFVEKVGRTDVLRRKHRALTQYQLMGI